VATHNVPSGEIFTGPVEESVEGHIQYDFPGVRGRTRNRRHSSGLQEGPVVDASATKNEKYFLAMLDMDPGARRLGELGIGTNYGIQQFIKNILFDEKSAAPSTSPSASRMRKPAAKTNPRCTGT
jgi:aminopeptidase